MSFIGSSDGANPSPGLILSGTTLYGTASGGGGSGNGTVFAIKTDGSGFMTFYSFSVTKDAGFQSSFGTEVYTNSDGAYPAGALALSGTTLFGTANEGGPSGSGTVFAIKTDGSGFMTLFSFSVTKDAGFQSSFGTEVYTNSGGAFPAGALGLSGTTLFGTAQGGGNSGKGTVFSISLHSGQPQLTIASSYRQRERRIAASNGCRHQSPHYVETAAKTGPGVSREIG